MSGGWLWARSEDRGRERLAWMPPRAADPWGMGARFTFQEGGGPLKRSNLTYRRPEVGWDVRLRGLELRTPGAHNAKIMLGYMDAGWRFTHGDDTDLAHWAGRPRVVLFIPVRHPQGADPADAGSYHISPYAGQTLSVVQFEAGDLIRYEWYRGGPERLHANVLFDLAPFATGDRDLRPGVNRPVFRFEVFDGGRWRVRIRRDGRGPDPADGEAWDHTFTESSPGARPYTVDLGRRPAFHLSVYNPSGSPLRGSEILLDLRPFRRADGHPLPRPDPAPFEETTLGRLPPAPPPPPQDGSP